MALNKGIWVPRPRATNIKGTNFKSLKEDDAQTAPAAAALAQELQDMTPGCRA